MRGCRRVAVGIACLLVVVGLGACASGGDDESVEQLPGSPSGKAEAANFNGVHSGELELVLAINRFKKKPEAVNLRILGTFVKQEDEALPLLDMAIESNGDLAGNKIAFLSGPLFRAEKWVINFEGGVYEPDQKSFEELRSKFEEAQEEEGSEGNPKACFEAAENFKVTDVVHRVSFEGKGETIDGNKIQTVGGDLDASAAIDELIKLSERSPGCRAQLEALGLPPTTELEELEQELKGSLTAARLTLSLDKHGVVRYLKLLASVELPRNEELEVDLLMRLTRVNEVTEVPYAHGYNPYASLLKKFGLDNQDVKQADAGEIFVGVLGVLADRMFGRETE